jgi:HD-GYP domain-containing protein (c-di-GMP phosphodiesterase class II)
MIQLSLDDVREGMRLGIAVRDPDGRILLGPGVVLNLTYISQLRQRGFWAVWIEDSDTQDIPYEENLSEATRVAATTAIRETFAMTTHEARELKSASIKEIRAMLKNPGFQKIFQRHPVIEALMGQVDRVVEEIMGRELLTGLNSIRSHDTYTYHHCLDMSVTGIMIGRQLGLTSDRLKGLAVGSILHDIGKIFVDDGILNKGGPLTPQEFKRMKDHTVLGYILLKDNLRLGILPPHVAYQHHERQDGSGYPRGLTGANKILRGREYTPGRITLMGEIAAIADFYDACISDRPYRKGFPPDQVWQMIRERAGTHFNREIVEVFLTTQPVFPLGIQVVVTEGRHKGYKGVVARMDRHALERPVVRLLTDPSGERIEPFEIDIAKDGEIQIRGIVRHGAMAPDSEGRD